MFAGRPDWHAPTHVAGRPAFAAYERPGQFYVAPVRLSATTQDQEPSFRLDIYQQDRGAEGLARFSLLSVGFTTEFDLDALRRTIDDSSFQADVGPIEAERGWVRLTSASALDLPEALHALQPLDIVGLGTMGLSVRLDDVSTDLFLGALRRGMTTIGAQAWVAIRGVAERIALTVAFDPAALWTMLKPLTQRSDAQDLYGLDMYGLDLGVLREVLISTPERLGFPMLSALAQEQKTIAANALIDRFCDRFAGLFPDVGVGAHIAAGQDSPKTRIVFDPARMLPGTIVWDLSEPLFATRMFAITADLLSPLREWPAAEWEARVVNHHDVRALGSGWHRVTIRQNLPARRIGMLQSQVELTAPPKLPMRPFTAKASARFDSRAQSATAELRLAPNEALAYRYKTAVTIIDQGRAERIEGPVRESEHENLVVSPDDFGVNFVIVEADIAFLSEARITVELYGTRRGRPWSTQGQLDASAYDIAFAVPHDVESPQIRAIARINDGTSDSRNECSMAPIAAEHLRLDAFSFEGSGRRSVDIECEFDDDKPQLVLELAPEGRQNEPARRHQIRMTPASATAQWSWLALSPFRSGYHWRWHGQSEWSEVAQPAQPLKLFSSRAP